jgi:hypothetical protein
METPMDDRDVPLPTGWADVPVSTDRRVVKVEDGTEWPIDFDRALWVDMDGERGYLVGSPHTHPGRFRVCFPDRSDSDYVTIPVSVHELTAISPEARYWLKGFLAGHSPSIDEYLGRDGYDGHIPTVEEWVRYEIFVERFLHYGSHLRLQRRPARALVITDEERSKIRVDDWRPWIYVGERVLVEDGAEWIETDPQPEMDGPWIAGTICAEREHDNLIGLESDWVVCVDCGMVEDTL